MQSLPVIASKNEEEFDFSLSKVAVGVHKSDTMDVLEEISCFRTDYFTLIDLDLPSNSCMIACTNTQSFVEEGEKCASTILVEHLEPLFHTLGSYITLFGSDMTLFGSNFKFQEPPVILVVVPVNFGVKNQVPHVSFKIVVGDLMLVFSPVFVDIRFCESLNILEAILDYGAQAFIFHSTRSV